MQAEPCSLVLTLEEHEPASEQLKISTLRGWKDSSAVKSVDCSSRGSWFNSQHPQGSSQPSLTPVLGGLTPLLEPLENRGMLVVHRHMCMQNTYNHKIKIHKYFFKERLYEEDQIA